MATTGCIRGPQSLHRLPDEGARCRHAPGRGPVAVDVQEDPRPAVAHRAGPVEVDDDRPAVLAGVVLQPLGGVVAVDAPAEAALVLVAQPVVVGRLVVLHPVVAVAYAVEREPGLAGLRGQAERLGDAVGAERGGAGALLALGAWDQPAVPGATVADAGDPLPAVPVRPAPEDHARVPAVRVLDGDHLPGAAPQVHRDAAELDRAVRAGDMTARLGAISRGCRHRPRMLDAGLLRARRWRRRQGRGQGGDERSGRGPAGAHRTTVPGTSGDVKVATRRPLRSRPPLRQEQDISGTSS